MKKSPTKAMVLAAAVTGALLLSGCTPGGGSSGSSSATGTVTVWTWTTPAAALKAVVPSFEASHPGVKIDVQDVGNPAIWDKITTGMAAGGAGLPDVMDIGVDYMGSYLEKFPNGLADLSKMGADQLQKDFVPSVWKSGSNASGQVYGVPLEANTATLYYRTDLLQKAGVDMSKIATWDDLIVAGTEIKKTTGASLLSLDKAATTADSANLWQMLTQEQGGFFFNAKGEITMNNTAGVKALSLIKRMNDAGIVADVPNDWNTYLDAVKTGKVATSPNASWFAGSMVSSLPEMSGKWGVSLPPAVQPGGLRAATTGASYLTISNTSSHQDLAWSFIKDALATMNGEQAMYAKAGLSPAYLPMYKAAGFVNPSPYFNGGAPNKIAIDELSQDLSSTNYTSDYSRALKLYDDAQTQILLKGADPKTALDAAANQLAQQTNRKIASN